MRPTFIAVIAASLLSLSTVACAEEPFSSSAHGEALYLVVSTQTEELQRLDADNESLENEPRTWSVFRLAGSGELDAASTFTVTFSMGGRVLASWYVNTGEGTVEPQPLEIVPELR